MILRSRGAKAPLLSVDLMPARVALNLRESGAVFPCKWCSVAEIYTKDCKPISHDDAIEDKIIVIRGNVLRPEFRHASHQLMLCTGGFGAQKNARGRTCYCISLYSGKQTSFYRGDVLGVMDKRSLPEWAKIGLQNALEIRQNEKSHPDERGEAR